MHALRNVPGQPVLPEVVGPDGQRPAVAVRHHQRLLVQRRQDSQGEEAEQPGEEHGLDVGDELGLANQAVEAGRLLQALQRGLD